MHSTCAVEIGQVTHREKGRDQLSRPKTSQPADLLFFPTGRGGTCARKRGQGFKGETSHMASLWRDAAPLCGHECGSLASQDAMDTLLHLEPQDAAVAVSTLRMATVEGRLRPVPEMPSPPQPPFRGRTECARLGTSLPRSFRPHMARSAGHAAPWPPQAVPCAGGAAHMGRSLGHAEPHAHAEGTN